jgi:hypothetical protein
MGGGRVDSSGDSDGPSVTERGEREEVQGRTRPECRGSDGPLALHTCLPPSSLPAPSLVLFYLLLPLPPSRPWTCSEATWNMRVCENIMSLTWVRARARACVCSCCWSSTIHALSRCRHACTAQTHTYTHLPLTFIVSRSTPPPPHTHTLPLCRYLRSSSSSTRSSKWTLSIHALQIGSTSYSCSYFCH